MTIKPSPPDTTTQNFTFETYEFGDGFSSSYFNDVWIFDENNIWAVGEVDSKEGLTNIMRWNGERWYAQEPWFTSSGFRGIWAIDSSNIYFAVGAIIKYEKGKFIETDLGNLGFTNGQGVHKLWGSSENNIYGVGPWGTIVYYNGQTWTKIDFDTQWYFYEITGNKQTGIAYAVAINVNDDCVVVKVNNTTTDIIYQKSKSEIKIASRTITELNNYLYMSGFDKQNLICRINMIGEPEIVHELPLTLGIRQSFALNKDDIYYAGDQESQVRIVHYNGARYKIFSLPEIDPDNYGGICAIKNLAVSVGFAHNKAYIIKIIRR